VTESEVLSLVRGEMRAAFEAGLAAAESAPFCDPSGPSCSGYRAALAEIEKTTASPPVRCACDGTIPGGWHSEDDCYPTREAMDAAMKEPQPSAAVLEMPPVFPMDDQSLFVCHADHARSLLDAALFALAEKDREIELYRNESDRMLREFQHSQRLLGAMDTTLVENIAAAEKRGASQQKQRDVAWLRARSRADTERVYAELGVRCLTANGRVLEEAASELEADGAGER
jgi:hypothetical protein